MKGVIQFISQQKAWHMTQNTIEMDGQTKIIKNKVKLTYFKWFTHPWTHNLMMHNLKALNIFKLPQNPW